MKNRRKLLPFWGLFFLTMTLNAQQSYFIDGYHGGVYGHYPKGYTRFIVEQLQRHPDWKINLEIEPETWDRERIEDPLYYNALAEMMQEPVSRIEYVNPSYAQSYLFNCSAESTIRQFSMGLEKLREHFPDISFRSYSSEEPCFTAALPAILSSFGVKYASSKNPNTCWAGYTAAFGNQDFVTWKAADGSSVLCVPRYASEKLEKNSTWQTNAWRHSKEYVEDALDSGVDYPIGMCLQDAGWRGGPWLKMSGHYMPVEFTLWSDYFRKYEFTVQPQTWRMSQEDIRVSLVWGAQVLQKIAQRVRCVENLLPQVEKIATMAHLWKGLDWENWKLKEAWRGLLLSQHHDCWIVPYNGKKGESWADKVCDWTSVSKHYGNEIINRSACSFGDNVIASDGVLVFNTLGYPRKEVITVSHPKTHKEYAFYADIPAMGYATYLWEEIMKQSQSGQGGMVTERGGKYIIDTEKYNVVINPKCGGAIESLKVKELRNKEFIDKTSPYAFNTLRGYFPEQKKFINSSSAIVRVTVLVNTPLKASVQIDGKIAEQPYSQILSFTRNANLIDCELRIDWGNNVQIGKETVGDFKAENPVKAFYNDKYKLHLLFPSIINGGVIDKNAPLDVCRSREEDTFFNSWDKIKHNLILNWVDNTDEEAQNGISLFSDHTTSYLHGKDYPLGLTVQYSGIGLWGRDYKIAEPTVIHYAILPHAGDWRAADIPQYSICWNEPLHTLNVSNVRKASDSLFEFSRQGYEIMACYMDGNDICLRVANTGIGNEAAELQIRGSYECLQWVELDGSSTGVVKVDDKIQLSIPPFGFKTLYIRNLCIK